MKNVVWPFREKMTCIIIDLIIFQVREIRANADSIEPSKLFVVELIATTAFRPYWEKRIIEDLGLQHTKRERLRNIRKGVRTRFMTNYNWPLQFTMNLLIRCIHFVRYQTFVEITFIRKCFKLNYLLVRYRLELMLSWKTLLKCVEFFGRWNTWFVSNL